MKRIGAIEIVLIITVARRDTDSRSLACDVRKPSTQVG